MTPPMPIPEESGSAFEAASARLAARVRAVVLRWGIAERGEDCSAIELAAVGCMLFAMGIRQMPDDDIGQRLREIENEAHVILVGLEEEFGIRGKEN